MLFFAAVPEREICAEDRESKAFDGRVMSCQPARTADDNNERGKGQRGHAAAHHRAPSVRHLIVRTRHFSSLQQFNCEIQSKPLFDVAYMTCTYNIIHIFIT